MKQSGFTGLREELAAALRDIEANVPEWAMWAQELAQRVKGIDLASEKDAAEQRLGLIEAFNEFKRICLSEPGLEQYGQNVRFKPGNFVPRDGQTH